MASDYGAHESHRYRFKRSDPVRIPGTGAVGVVDSAVFQRIIDYPNEYAAGYHAVLDYERVVTVRWYQVIGVHV
jgi:hypothetical protein